MNTHERRHPQRILPTLQVGRKGPASTHTPHVALLATPKDALDVHRMQPPGHPVHPTPRRARAAAAITLTLLLLTGCARSRALTPAQIQTASPTELVLAMDGASHVGLIIAEPAGTKQNFGSLHEYWRQLREAGIKAYKLDAEEAALVRSGEIKRGMTWMALNFSWGGPQQIHKSKSPMGTTERWDYSFRRYPENNFNAGPKAEVTLQDGYVTWWHEEGR